MGRTKKEDIVENEEGSVASDDFIQVTENLHLSFDDRNIIVSRKKIKGEGEHKGRGRKLKEENIGQAYFVSEAWFPKYYGVNAALKYCVSVESFLNVSDVESILYNQEKIFKYIDDNFALLKQVDTSMREVIKETKVKEIKSDDLVVPEVEIPDGPTPKKKGRGKGKKKIHKTITGESY